MATLPSGERLHFTLGVYLTMLKDPAGCDHPAYGTKLSDILSKAKRGDGIVRDMIEIGVMSLNDAAQKPATTMIGSVVQDIQRRRLQLQGMQLLSSREYPITVLDLQALAVQHQFSIVVIETTRRSGALFEPRSIRIIYPDDRLVSDPIPTAQLSEQLDQRVDDALWLVLTKDRSSSNAFSAHPAFRYPAAAWFDLTGPPVYVPTLDTARDLAHKWLKKECARQTGFSIEETTDLQRSILFYLSLSEQAKQFRGRSRVGTDLPAAVATAENEEATTTEGEKRRPRKTQDTAWIAKLFKLDKSLHKLFKGYIKDKCLDVWRPLLEQVDFAAQMVSRGFATPVDSQLLEHPPAPSARHQDREADDRNPFLEQLDVAHDGRDGRDGYGSAPNDPASAGESGISRQGASSHEYPLVGILEAVSGVHLFGEGNHCFVELVEELARSPWPCDAVTDAAEAAPSPAGEKILMGEELGKLSEMYDLEDAAAAAVAAAAAENDPSQTAAAAVSHIGQPSQGGTKRKQEAIDGSRDAKHGRKEDLPGWPWEQ